jgi:branched-chain amino acid transport system substrate-binding protein
MRAGYQLAFDEINADGGIKGREVKLVVKDDSYDPAKGVAAVRELVEREKAIAVTGLGTATVQGAREYLDGKKVPMLFPSGSTEGFTAPAGYTLLAQPSYKGQAYLAAKYSIERQGSSKVGILRLDASPGVEAADGCTQAAEEAGAEIVGNIAVQPTSSDFSGALAKLRSDGADAICNASTLEMAGIQMKQAEQMGWKPNWFGWAALANDKLAELGGPQAEGVLVATSLQFSSDDPEVTTFRQNLAKASPDTDPGYYAALGYWGGHMIGDALEEAGPDASPTDVRDAVLKWSDHPAPSNLSGSLTFAPDKPLGLTASFVGELKDGKIAIVSGPDDPGF